MNSVREGNIQRFFCLLSHKKLLFFVSWISIDFVHPKSLQRYIELFCLLFKLPFPYPFQPLQLFPLLFCFFFKLPFSYPSHPLQLFLLLFCLLFKLLFSYPFHPLLLFSLLFCLLFKLLFSYPFHPLLLFPLLFCLLFKQPFFIHFTRYNCSLCYSVFFYPLSHLPHPTIVTVFFVTLSPLTLSLFHFFVALSYRSFSLLFLKKLCKVIVQTQDSNKEKQQF